MLIFVSLLLLLFLLLVFHTAVINGTQNGLLLWYQTLIPSLLPFLLLTNALSETNAYHAFVSHFKKHRPRYIYEFIAILLGNLCGYPIGGKIINDFVSNNHLSSRRANQILALSSQASPMFLIGYVHLHIIKNKLPLSVFLLSIYLPVLLVLPFVCKNADIKTYQKEEFNSKKIFICDTFIHAVETMVIIGIYVILFSIFLELIRPLCKSNHAIIPLSFLEITTGLKMLTKIKLPYIFKICTICSLSAFGGLCSAFQIKGVLNYKNADIKKYLLHKLILSAGTFLLIFIYMTLTNQPGFN